MLRGAWVGTHRVNRAARIQSLCEAGVLLGSQWGDSSWGTWKPWALPTSRDPRSPLTCGVYHATAEGAQPL